MVAKQNYFLYNTDILPYKTLTREVQFLLFVTESVRLLKEHVKSLIGKWPPSLVLNMLYALVGSDGFGQPLSLPQYKALVCSYLLRLVM